MYTQDTAVHQPVIDIIADRKVGILMSRVLAMPTRAYAKAQNGNASGSLATSAAVPIPCDAAAVDKPRAMGSCTPLQSSSARLMFAPSTPAAHNTRVHSHSSY